MNYGGSCTPTAWDDARGWFMAMVGSLITGMVTAVYITGLLSPVGTLALVVFVASVIVFILSTRRVYRAFKKEAGTPKWK